MNVTIVIIIVTASISVLAFQNNNLFSRLQFNPYQVFHRKEYYRLLTHGFIHVGWWHLIVNMFVLFFFGRSAEAYLGALAQAGYLQHPVLIYVVLYITSIVFATSITLFRYKDNYLYNSVGASGAVSAVMFFSIFFDPWQKLYLYAAIPIPGIIFAVAYVIYTQYMSKKQSDNINHDAHLLGAVYGFLFPLFIDLSLISIFINRLINF
ncbi:MAG: rhomboid family intramembrane serine protease [Bacteroidales bacterium]|nr:rhomboid family intramembrane serine protease [Bacteroidales bacterium]MBN2818467.1 rhomboid family intramembrane serine protease [Bacteroidales bacterium]